MILLIHKEAPFMYGGKSIMLGLVTSLRWLNTVPSTYIWMGRYNHSLMLKSWYKKTAQSLVNMLSPFF